MDEQWLVNEQQRAEPDRTGGEIAEVCLLAGRIMLQSGGETSRVEDTMMRIAASYGIAHSQSYVTPTGILFATEGTAPTTRLTRVSERSTDLHKVTRVNDVSRRISRGELTAKEALEQLRDIDRARPTYPDWLQIVAAAAASGCFLMLFQGSWRDFLPAMLAGGIGFAVLLYFHRLVPIKFFAEFLAAIVIGLCAVLVIHLGWGQDLDKMIIGSVMPLVPGLLITNAVRDLMAGHFVSGLSKGAEAFLTAFAIGAGIAVTLSLN